MIALTLVVVDNVFMKPLVMVGKTAVMIRLIVPTPWRLQNPQEKGKGKGALRKRSCYKWFIKIIG